MTLLREPDDPPEQQTAYDIDIDGQRRFRVQWSVNLPRLFLEKPDLVRLARVYIDMRCRIASIPASADELADIGESTSRLCGLTARVRIENAEPYPIRPTGIVSLAPEFEFELPASPPRTE